MSLSSGKVSVFCFAHQDDEFAILSMISDAVEKGNTIYCLYLTSGVRKGLDPSIRNGESTKVLEEVGVNEKSILFIGEQLGVCDGDLPSHMPQLASWLLDWLPSVGVIDNIFIPSWEGGHQDHDATHAIILVVAARLGILETVFQYPFYNANRCIGPFFRVFSTLKSNAVVNAIPISAKRRLKYLLSSRYYRSQIKTWLGLWPFVIYKYLFHPQQRLQNVSLERLLHRPHHGKLYYEKRGFYTWVEMERNIRVLMEWN